MKKGLFFEFILLFVLALFLQDSSAQDSPQWRLPENVKARIGKGRISEFQYSPDGTRLAVASSVGIWIYDTATLQEVELFTEHTSWVVCIAFSPDGQTLAGGEEREYPTIRLWDVATGMQIGSLASLLARMGKRWQVEVEARPSVCGMSQRVNTSEPSTSLGLGFIASRLVRMEGR